MFPISMAPGPHSSISEEFLHSIILRPKKPLGSWNLVNPLLSMNEAWMDECAARLQPLVDQYKPRQHQTFAIEKFRDLIVTTRSCPGDKKKSLLISRIGLSTRNHFSLFHFITLSLFHFGGIPSHQLKRSSDVIIKEYKSDSQQGL